jgi:hypothetical protein
MIMSHPSHTLLLGEQFGLEELSATAVMLRTQPCH